MLDSSFGETLNFEPRAVLENGDAGLGRFSSGYVLINNIRCRPLETDPPHVYSNSLPNPYSTLPNLS